MPEVILEIDLTYKAMTQLDEHQWEKIQILSKLIFWVPAEHAFSKDVIGTAAKLSLIWRGKFSLTLK